MCSFFQDARWSRYKRLLVFDHPDGLSPKRRNAQLPMPLALTRHKKILRSTISCLVLPCRNIDESSLALVMQQCFYRAVVPIFISHNFTRSQRNNPSSTIRTPLRNPIGDTKLFVRFLPLKTLVRIKPSPPPITITVLARILAEFSFTKP